MPAIDNVNRRPDVEGAITYDTQQESCMSDIHLEAVVHRFFEVPVTH